MKRILLSSFFLAGLSLPGFAQLGGEVTGDSARMAALAGAGLAGGEDLLEASHNPAMLGFVIRPGKGFSFEANLRGLTTPVSGVSKLGEDFAMTDTAALAPFIALGFPAWGPFRFSFALRPTSGGKASMLRETELLWDESVPGSGDFDIPRYDDVLTANEMVQVAGEPTMSFFVTPEFSIGLGASFRSTTFDMQSAADVPFADMTGDSGLGGSYGDLLLGDPPDPDRNSFQAEFEGSLEGDLMTCFQLGAALQLNPSNRLGFWYRLPSSAIDLEGSVHVDASADLGPFIDALGLPYEPGTQSDFDISIPDIRFPAQLGFAFANGLTQKDRFHGQVVWTEWSQSFDGWTATLSNPDSPEWQEFLGGDDPSTSVDLDMVWTNTLAFSFGWEHDFEWLPRIWREQRMQRSGITEPFVDLTARLGLAWSNNPIRGTAMAGLMPFNAWHVGAGISRRTEDGNEWFLSSVVALPESWTAGENKVLDDFDNDTYSQFSAAIVLGYRYSW
jgi:long-subunit fatty acid transport protein